MNSKFKQLLLLIFFLLSFSIAYISLAFTVESDSSNVLYAHAETTTIDSSSYYKFKPLSADGPATILSASAAFTGRKLMGKWVYPLSEIESIPASTWTVTYRVMKSACASYVVAHCDIDILIRKSDGTVRTTIATNVANSSNINLVNIWVTLTGTYNWPGYAVIDPTDYLEVDFYIEVTNPQSSKYVMLLVDDPTLPLADQTKVEGVVFVPIIKYYLIVKTDPEDITVIPGEDWYKKGTEVILTAPDSVPVSAGVRYKFSYWDVDGTPKTDNTITVVMDANHTATAHYVLEYYLTVVSPFGTVGGEGWYPNGSTAYVTLNTGLVDHGNGTRRVFVSWGGDASGTNYVQSIPITMNSPKTAVANWKTQYAVAFTQTGSGVAPTVTYTADTDPTETVPFTVWVLAGSQITYAYQDIVPGAVPGVRYILTGVNPPSPQTVNAPFTVSASYQVQYYLTVSTDPPGIATIPGEGWYNLSQSVQLTAPTVTGYTFQYWDVDGASQGSGVNPITVVMNAPHTATAHYTAVVPTYKLKIETTAGGTTNPAPGTYTYAAGLLVQVTAVPSSGYVFDHWELNGTNVGTGTTYTVTMNANYVLKAFFKTAPTPPTVSISPMTASIMVGQQVTFTSSVSGGTPPYTYQWFVNNNPVPGATSSSFTFTPTTAGTYYVVLKVTDAAGNTAQSDPARVTVSSVPVGGYSVSLPKNTPITPTIAYTMVMALFASLLSLTKRKRK